MGIRRWILRLVMMSLAFATVFVVLEIALRLTGRSESGPEFRTLFMPDDRIGYRLRPGAHARLATPEFDSDIQINNQGIRDEEIGPKPSHEYRIIVLGDSMVMAVQVAFGETFCHLLERRLNRDARPPRTYRVINAGVQGYGPVEEYLFFSRVASAFRPDLVLEVIFVGNDAVEAADSEPRLDPGTSKTAEVRRGARTWLRRMARRSAAIQFLRRGVLTELGREGKAPLRERPLDSYFAQPPSEVLRGFAVARECVRRIADLAAANGGQTVVVLLPARFQLDEADFTTLAGEIRQTGARLTVDGASARFREALAELSVPVLDLLPGFRGTANAKELYFRRNVHLSPRGHEVVAGALADFLHERHLLAKEELVAGARYGMHTR